MEDLKRELHELIDTLDAWKIRYLITFIKKRFSV